MMGMKKLFKYELTGLDTAQTRMFYLRVIANARWDKLGEYPSESWTSQIILDKALRTYRTTRKPRPRYISDRFCKFMTKIAHKELSSLEKEKLERIKRYRGYNDETDPSH